MKTLNYKEIGGYKVAFFISKRIGSKFTFKKIVIKNPDGRFLPELYVEYDFDSETSTQKIEVKMQTTSYGALGYEDSLKVIEGLNTGLKVLEYCKTIDWSEAEIIEFND